jgi:serine/threonine-protein kinase
MTDETPTSAGAGTSGPTPQKPVTTVTTGTLIMGTYEIEKLINSGGMGEVYRGRNIHNNELVAIKIVLPSLAHDPKIVALFQKESTTLSRLAHEAIVRYHVFTNDPTIGRPCMVMEFVSGTSLADRIEQGPMPLEDVKVMLRRVASGLEKAHRAGVVHRDLSPDNVILEEDAVEHAKLIDFGIAKSSNFGSGTLLQGQFAGKFNWVSPEQLGAFGGQVDGRSDIYSLALIIAGVSRGKVLQMGASIVDAVSKRASVPDLEGVDPAIQPLLRWMLEPDPGQRVESMAKVIQALDNPALVPGKEQFAPPPPDPNRTVIEPLPVHAAAPTQTSAPVALDQGLSLPPMAMPPGASVSAPRVATAPPRAVTGWDLPPAREKSMVPPDGATVFAPQAAFVAPPPREEEPEDFSPFGATVSPATKAQPAPVQVKPNGKGGLISVLALLAVAVGGGGAYFAGVFDPKTPTPLAPAEQATTTEPVKPAEVVEDTAAKAAEAAAKAEAAAVEAAAEAAKTAETNAVADAASAAEAAAAEARSQAEAVEAARSMAETALADANDAAKVASEAERSLVQGLADAAQAAASKARAAADAASAGLAAATKAAETAKTSEASAVGMDELMASVKANAEAATAGADSAEVAANKAAESARIASEAETARLAEEKAKQEKIQADPIARQQAFFDSLTAADCTHLQLSQAKAEGFLLQGYALETKPLEDQSAAWAAETEITPEIAVRLINEEQCEVLNFLNKHKSDVGLGVTMSTPGDLIKSGTPVEGMVEGANGRPFTLLLVSGKGGATNLKPVLKVGEDGKVRFKFTPKLKEGSAPVPHLLLAIVTSEALNLQLDRIEAGTGTYGEKGLLRYIEKQMEVGGGAPSAALTFFRLEN